MEYRTRANLEQAVAEFRKLRESDPTMRRPYYHAGQALEKLGRLDEAREF